MDNSSYRDLYIEELNSKPLSDLSIATISNLWKRVKKHEISVQKSLEEGYTKEEFAALFEEFNVGGANGFLTYKSTIKKYLVWLVKEHGFDKSVVSGIIHLKYEDVNTDDLLDKKFFKNFNDLQSCIELTMQDSDKVDDGIFATQISAIYLAWCGLKIEETLQLTKSNVKEQYIRVGNRIIQPDEIILEYLKKYRDATEYQSAARTVITLKYVKSEWLFRTVRSAHVDNPENMRIFIRNFGRGSRFGNMFTYDKVYWSGVYHRAYLYECANGKIQNSDVETINKIFGENYTNASYANKRLQTYRRYTKHFFAF